MAFEDKNLTCVQCNQEFVFSSGEQEFFAGKNLDSPPKRCKSCRQQNKKKRQHRNRGRRGPGEYRSPAFESSAPTHQKMHSRPRRDYRSPTFQNSGPEPQGDYRSPAFREQDAINPEDEYRAPGFKEYENINPEDEYRAPGFKEADETWTDQRPEFSIICSACGKEAMVPFLPEEKESPMCRECYKAHREQLKKEEKPTEE